MLLVQLLTVRSTGRRRLDLWRRVDARLRVSAPKADHYSALGLGVVAASHALMPVTTVRSQTQDGNFFLGVDTKI